VVVELDGRQFHDAAEAFELDRLRDRALVTAGWAVLRVTWRQLGSGREALARDLTTLLVARRAAA
jgi:very-short-patch-repair endonuclease